jgi:type III restriction enzyme
MFKPKAYQEETLSKLAACLESARFESENGARKAFDAVAREVPKPWNKPYVHLERLPDTPYVCLRLPTGGGKTFLAALAVKHGAKFLSREHNPLVLWMVPTDAIRRQTLETLTKPGHPNRETLEADFGESKVRVLDIEDFADLTPQDLRDKACIVISTFAALRVEKTEGRKFYEHKEALEPHFATVAPNTPALEVHTDGPDKGKIKKSCANIMALIRPLVIVDEAHNAKTDLSYDVLNRVRAGCVIEFTATPATDSNVLHHVSASVLKTESMIKLPIMLTEYPSWQEALTDSILQRAKLEELARNEPDFVRPVVLIQAESKDREVTVEVVRRYLVDQGKIEPARIAVATGSQRDLDDVNLLDPTCKIEFVITVQALKEGWDCPFAYVFCSVATVHSPKDVEQLLGRVLRMPWAKRRSYEDLNRAYAFVSKACWPQAVNLLHDRLVNMGFDEVEAAQYLKHEEPQLPNIGEPEPAQLVLTLREAPALDNLPHDIRGNVAVTRNESGTYSVSITGTIPQEVEEKFVAAAPPAEQEAVRRKLAARRERILTPAPERPKVVPMQVPQLCLLIDGELEPAQEEHFLSPDSWSLLDYPAELSEAEFRVEERTDTYEIDVQGKRLVERHLNTQSVFDFHEVPTNWTDLQLSRELDPPLRRKDIRQGVLLEFIRRTLRYLEERRGIGLNTLYRVRAPLERVLREKIEQYRQKAFSAGYQMRLFSPEAAIETSYDYSFAFDPENYPATLHYHGAFQFPKHYYAGMVGDFDSKEELECAKAIEMCPRVKRWVRNVRGMFGLPTASGTFYPDFIAELDDGRILVAEYKGEHLIQHEQEKKNIGELWESKSKGKALFMWAVKKDAAGRDVHRQLEDKIVERS